jgi:hypothetical protein
MPQTRQDTPALYRVTEAVFWLLLLVIQLPTVSALWLLGKLMQMSELFRAFVVDLVRWRGRR